MLTYRKGRREGKKERHLPFLDWRESLPAVVAVDSGATTLQSYVQCVMKVSDCVAS
jgi:hypothetical protein